MLERFRKQKTSKSNSWIGLVTGMDDQPHYANRKDARKTGGYLGPTCNEWVPRMEVDPFGLLLKSFSQSNPCESDEMDYLIELVGTDKIPAEARQKIVNSYGERAVNMKLQQLRSQWNAKLREPEVQRQRDLEAQRQAALEEKRNTDEYREESIRSRDMRLLRAKHGGR
jgi:hypothetical protein